MSSHSNLFISERETKLPFRAMIFDLDGTLCDTLGDIAEVGNATLTHFGQPIKPVQDYRKLAGQGVKSLLENALDSAHLARLDEAIRFFKAFQLEHGNGLAQPFEGIPEVLDEIKRLGLKLGVLSNKPHPATEAMIQSIFSNWSFDLILGHKPEFPLKPDPTSANWMCDELDLKPEEVLYIGDTAADMGTATGAGFYGVGVLWGFRDKDELLSHGAKAIANKPSDLIEIMHHHASCEPYGSQ